MVLDAQSPNPAALMQARIYIGEDDILIFRDESPRHTSYMMREGSASELYDYERELGQNMEQVVSETLRQRVLIEAYPTMISLAGARFTISFVRPGEPIGKVSDGCWAAQVCR